jgi:hypothetical protein
LGLAFERVATKKKRRLAPIVQLAEIREKRRMSSYQEKIFRVLESNRRALGRLYSTGALFSRQGVRAGRDLLLAHQNLLKVVSLLNGLADATEVCALARTQNVESVYRQLDGLLDRTCELTHRTGHYLACFEGE